MIYFTKYVRRDGAMRMKLALKRGWAAKYDATHKINSAANLRVAALFLFVAINGDPTNTVMIIYKLPI
ncbi:MULTISPECIES: hypothetical protein [unclassified Enterobacter]|jgi:hypothetical protein|uniref:hypothetical protein n=1 Tax=unclassified Enterobacter TaxID=2608935 RepID=UPI0015C77BB1|nr:MULTISPECIES: hypothetical protein [unclassified Enterobacter]MBB3304088.1 hypothetical protein [Enterobacter sp. Sphag1F]NYI12807.1 hypothetical protein [Enterobacter sp. Sphag71]